MHIHNVHTYAKSTLVCNLLGLHKSIERFGIYAGIHHNCAMNRAKAGVTHRVFTHIFCWKKTPQKLVTTFH